MLVKGVGMVEAVTVAGLARMAGKSKNTLMRYERKDILPLAPLKVGNRRYYPVSLAARLVPLLQSFPVNQKPDPDAIVQINRLFKEEKEKLLCRKLQDPQKKTRP